MPSGSYPNLSNTDTVYPEHLSRLHRRVVPKKRKGGSSRYRTQPVTFSEIQEMDEDNVVEESVSCRTTSTQELRHLNEKFEEFRRISDLLFISDKEEFEQENECNNIKSNLKSSGFNNNNNNNSKKMELISNNIEKTHIYKEKI